jgi:hypothetical protein
MARDDDTPTGLNLPLIIGAVVLVTIGIGAAATRQGLGRSVASDEAYGRYVGACTVGAGGAGVDVTVCNARITKDGDACFRASWSSGSKTTPPGLDVERFTHCVDMGHDAWQTEEGVRRRAERAATRQ